MKKTRSKKSRVIVPLIAVTIFFLPFFPPAHCKNLDPITVQYMFVGRDPCVEVARYKCKSCKKKSTEDTETVRQGTTQICLKNTLSKLIEGIVQPKKRGVERGTI